MQSDNHLKQIKIMVNFRTHQCIQCIQHRGSDYYNQLIAMGYEETGTINLDRPETDIYWHPPFFDPRAKYTNSEANRKRGPNRDTINT